MIKLFIFDLIKNLNIIFWIINYDKVKKKLNIFDFQFYIEDVNWFKMVMDVYFLLLIMYVFCWSIYVIIRLCVFQVFWFLICNGVMNIVCVKYSFYRVG